MPDGQVLPSQVLDTPSRPRRSVCDGSLSAIELVAIVWFAPPEHVGTLMPMSLLPPAYVRCSVKLIVVPQTNELEVWKRNAVAFAPLASIARLEYVELFCVTVTPLVDVDSVAEMPVSLPQ